MRRLRTIFFTTLLAAALFSLLCQPAFAAVSEGDVQAQVAASGKESVSGNILIWFLCAVSFLKISQKIDSFMASLGVKVGNTGGSMMAEALIATRGLSSIRNSSSQLLGGGHSSSAHHNSNSSYHSNGAETCLPTPYPPLRLISAIRRLAQKFIAKQIGVASLAWTS